MVTVDLRFVPKLSRKARVKYDRHSGRHMIIYPERGLELNEAAAAIAGRCDGSRSIQQITDELTQEHEGAPRDAIEKDVIDFIVTLRDRGLLENA